MDQRVPCKSFQQDFLESKSVLYAGLWTNKGNGPLF